MAKPVYADFDQETLDREYSPSSCIDDIGVYLDAYAVASAAARERAAEDHHLARDLAYGRSAGETLDLFRPTAKAPVALHVFIHGGFWQQLSKEESAFAAPLFLRHGVAFAALDYTLTPVCSLTDIVTECRRAFAWLYGNAPDYGVDPNRMFLSGHSAGAQLGMMLLTTDWTTFGLPRNLVKGVCAVSGVYDLEPVRLSYVNDAVGMDAAEAQRMSPVNQTLRNRCPIAFTYGDNETCEFKRQTDVYVNKLTNSDADVRFREIEDRNHFDIVLDLAREDSWLAGQALRQIRQYGAPGRQR